MKKASTSLFLTLAAAAGMCGNHAFPSSPSPSLHRPLHVVSAALRSSSADETEQQSSSSLSPELRSRWEEKNRSRSKFGLEPLDLSEFLELQAQVARMHHQQELKHAEEQQRRAAAASSQPGGFLQSLVPKGLVEDTCLSSFDCESPKVCCDLGFKKMCCSNGMLEVSLEYASVPVPVDMRE